MFYRIGSVLISVLFVFGCGSVEPSASRGGGGGGGGGSGGGGSVSIEITPHFEAVGANNNPFASCLSNYEQRFVGEFGKRYYSTLTTLANQNGINIQELGLADRDIVIVLRLNADNARQQVKVQAEVVSMNSSGRVMRRKVLSGDTVRFKENISPQETCKVILGHIASQFNNQVMGSATELADETINLMIRRRF